MCKCKQCLSQSLKVALTSGTPEKVLGTLGFTDSISNIAEYLSMFYEPVYFVFISWPFHHFY